MADAQGQPMATEQDIANCYRLLLGRQPDQGGLDHYRQRLGAGLPVDQLVAEFLGSVEFARAHPQLRSSVPAVEVAQTIEGFVLHVDANDFAVGHTIARTGTYEPEVSAVVRRSLLPGATFVDVGANIGWFSMLAAQVVGQAGRVLAIEPNPVNVELLRQSAASNGYGHVDARVVALAEGPGAVALETDGSNGRIITLNGPPAAPVAASFVVGAHSLDHIVSEAGLGRVDMVKIDVEGAEPMVLRGGAATIMKSHPTLVTEFYPLALDTSPWGTAAGYLAQLRQYGYRLSVIGQDDNPVAGHTDARIMEVVASRGHDHVDLLCTPA